MKKKKIIIIHQNMVIGGVEKVTLNLLNNLDKNKFKIHLILIERYGELLDKLPKNIDITYLLEKSNPTNKKNFIKYIFYLYEMLIMIKKLNRILTKEDIILNMNLRNMRLNLMLMKYRNKKLTWLHTTISADKHNKFFIKKIKEKLYDQYKVIFNVSEQGKKDFEKEFPKLLNKSKLLYNSFDIDRIRELSLAPLDISLKYYIIAVGRLNNRHKGFDILIKAIKKLKDEGREIKLVIIGEGPDKELILEQIKQLKLEEEIYLYGFDKNPYRWMKNAELLVLPSNYEGLPTVLIEALACEVPIVSTDCKNGPKEILLSGEYGMLTPVGRDDKLAESIKKIFFNEKIKLKYKEKSLKRAYDFSNKINLKILEDILEN